MLATQWMSKLRLMFSRPAKATLFATLLAAPLMTLGLADQATAATHKKHASKTSSGKASAGKSKQENAKTSRHTKTQLAKGKAPKSQARGRAVVRHVEVIDRPSIGDKAGLKHSDDPLALASNVAYVVDQDSSKVLFEKNAEVSLPIASITKLMTSLVVVEAKLDLNEMIEITNEDLDKEKGTGSRLQVGAKLSRADLLHIALMSSENRAASALGRNYPGGLPAFVNAMNAKAKQLGMNDTNYVDSSGLSSKNVASARDLVKLINAAYQYPLIREYSTDSKYVVTPNPNGRRTLEYGTTNKLVAEPDWNIGLQKTGYISEAGRCLVMQAIIEGRNVVMVFLDSKGKYSRLADAGRIKKWIQATMHPQAKQYM
ncbi:D-alanyl-D-alanine endopeptidase [Undibacterium cyanobacteriorum]|uniref:D-alanyl-D-alanine endopeptidase n=1 Tax=Undibacterium cyanobacteriorum TaxID=3073561 RepID=A0ABY9RNU6_9BURK|nr:D-alanyl-D-alanine endopeptidase [Undibacterium sp. 20NA77.5]WMW82350.1 D-alanyl-D-alanine endopeptidase [Undibacterium sp. 20NA77.5]